MVVGNTYMDLDDGCDESDDDAISRLGSIEKLEELSLAGPESEPESLPSLDWSDRCPGESMMLPADDDDRPSCESHHVSVRLRATCCLRVFRFQIAACMLG